MLTPTTFFLPEPIDNSSYPTCRPPKLLKHQIYENPEVFEKVDNHAIKIAKNTYPTFRDLLWELVFSLKLSELEKARAIFRWMTMCDMNSINFQTSLKGSPEEILLGIKKCKTSYASTFELICSYSGLFCLTLNGYVKGVDYHPGDVFSGQAFNHNWNATFIEGSWQLIDTQWATRYSWGGKSNQNVIVYQYDDFYFLMEPQQAVYSHFPQDSIWQLLKEPFSISQFESLPYIKSQFFKCGMDFYNQYHGVVRSKDGYLKMTLGFCKPDGFTYKLVTENNSNVFQGIPLHYFVIQETVDNQINFYFRFPAAGIYFLTVFVKELDKETDPAKQEHIFRAACEYKIIADKASKIPLPFPMSCHGNNWGLQSSLVSHYNLASSQENGVISISSPDNKPFVRTEIRFDKTREDVEILCKLRKNGVEDEDILDQYIEVIEKSDQSIFILNLPEPDEYALEIYANEPSEEDTFTLIGQYLLDFDAPPGYKPQSSVFGPITADSMILLRDAPSNIREMYDYEKNVDPIGPLPRLYLQSNYVPEEITMIPNQANEQSEPFHSNKGNDSSESDIEMPDFLPPLPPPPSLINASHELKQDVLPGVGGSFTMKGAYVSDPLSTDVVINQSMKEMHSMMGLTDESSLADQIMTSGEKMTPGSYKNEYSGYVQGSTPFTKPSGDDNNLNLKIGDNDPGSQVMKSSLHSEERYVPDDKMWISDTESIQQSDKLQPYLASVEKGLSPQLSRHVYGSGSQNKGAESNLTYGKVNVNLSNSSKFRTSPTNDLNRLRPFDSDSVSDQSSKIPNDFLKNEESLKPLIYRGYGRPNFISEPNDSLKGNFKHNQYQASSTNPDALNTTIRSTINPPLQNQFKRETSAILGPTPFPGVYGARSVSKSDEMIANTSLLKGTGYKDEASTIPGVANLKSFFEARNSESFNPNVSKDSLYTDRLSERSTSGYSKGTLGARIPVSYDKSLKNESFERKVSENKELSKSADQVFAKGSGDDKYSVEFDKMSNKAAFGTNRFNEDGTLAKTAGTHFIGQYPALNQSATDKSSGDYNMQRKTKDVYGNNYQYDDRKLYDVKNLSPSSINPYKESSLKIMDPENLSRSHEVLNYNRFDNLADSQVLQKNIEHTEDWSKRSDLGYLSRSNKVQNPVYVDNSSGNKIFPISNEHLTESFNKSDPGYSLGSSGVQYRTGLDNSPDNRSVHRSSEHLEERSNKLDPGYNLGSSGVQYRTGLDNSPDNRSVHRSSEHLEESSNKLDSGYRLRSSGVQYRPGLGNSLYNQGFQRNIDHSEERWNKVDPGYILGSNEVQYRTGLGNSPDNRSFQRTSEHLEERSDKLNPGYILGPNEVQYRPGLGNSPDNRSFHRSSEHVEERSDKLDQGYLLRPSEVPNPSGPDNSYNEGFQRSSQHRQEWFNKADPGYLSGSIKAQPKSNEYQKEWSNKLDPHYISGPYADRNEDFSRISDNTYYTSTYGVRGNTKSVDHRGDSNVTRLTPSILKIPKDIGVPSDQYNNQYEDSYKILPSPFAHYNPDESTANWTSGPVQKEPPKNFQPTPIAIEEEIYRPEMQALPNVILKNNVISPEETSKIFQRIDDHAIQVSAQHQDSFNQLIWQLIYARNITDEIEKVRVIFLWLCTKDLHKMTFDDIKNDSPEEILMGLKSGKNTYAQIFHTLCRYAGLHSKLISGYAKGADYVPGMKFEGRLGEHSWNSVLLTGVWRLVDCHWAARRLIGKERKPENVRYELDMFYFLANPSQLIYTHFPHDIEWQLLHHPVNIEEFESLAPVKSMFFKYNLDLLTHKNAIINSYAPEFELKIGFPKGVEQRLLFTFTLTLGDGSEDYKDISLLRYGRHEIDYVNYHSCFWIRAPAPGSYKLLIYAKLISAGQSAPDSGSQSLFGAICEYKIEFVFPSGQTLLPFPSCQTPTYGPTEVFKNYPIEPCTSKSSIYTDNGIAEIQFIILKPEIRLMAKLISNSGKNSDQLSEQCIIQRLVANKEIIISVYLPEPSEYGLEVYANNVNKDGNSFYTVWQFFIVANKASTVKGLPSLSPGYMGPFEPKFTNYGLSTYSHKDPFIVTNTGDLSIQLKTMIEKPVRIMTQLIHCSNNVSEICSNRVLQQFRDSIVYFLVRFPKKGFFKLQIFALPYSETSENLPGVFNYLILGNQSSCQGVPFPQQFAQWKEGCYLYEPINGELAVRLVDSVMFRMDVPRAIAVAVVVNNEWTRLDKDANGTWNGKVNVKLPWGKSDIDPISVCANYGKMVDDSFTTILKYSVQ